MARPILTLERLKQVLSYDPEDGRFTWIARCSPFSRIQIGAKAGDAKAARGNPYLGIEIDGRRYYLHRLAWFYTTGEWPKDTIDHIDRNRTNNRFVNLRDIPRGAQSQNMRCRDDNKAQLLGVVRTQKLTSTYYRASIRINGRGHDLGSFGTPEAAHAAYILHGGIHEGRRLGMYGPTEAEICSSASSIRPYGGDASSMEENALVPIAGSWKDAFTVPSAALCTAPGASPSWLEVGMPPEAGPKS